MAKIEGIEIPDDLLAAVSGGVITPKAREEVPEILRFLKSHGITKQQIIDGWSVLDTEEDHWTELVEELYDTV